MLASSRDAGDETWPTMADREGRLTARRHRPHSRMDQKTVSVSSTVSGGQRERSSDGWIWVGRLAMPVGRGTRSVCVTSQPLISKISVTCGLDTPLVR